MFSLDTILSHFIFIIENVTNTNNWYVTNKCINIVIYTDKNNYFVKYKIEYFLKSKKNRIA